MQRWAAKTKRMPQAGEIRPARAAAPPHPHTVSETSDAALCVATYAAGQRREYLLRRDGLHGRINGLAAAVRGLDPACPEYFKIAPARPVARRIGGTEDRRSGLAQRGCQMQRAAIHAHHERGAARC